jgi:HlyD family secretion protein
MAETSTSDLSTLKIDRQKNDQPGNVKPRRVLVLSVTAAVVLAVLYFVFRGMMAGTREVEVGTATLTSPSQANTILTASGYVVAQIKAAVASKGTGRLVYLGFEEGDIVKKDQIIARLEDGDVIAALDRKSVV